LPLSDEENTMVKPEIYIFRKG